MEIESIELKASLKWKSINEECLICNNTIGNKCIKCDININSIGCISIFNKNPECKHSFHYHCLQQYHRNNGKKCPMCSAVWTGI